MSCEDEPKKREVIYKLLKNDIKFYNNFLPEIKNFNSEQFDNLFNGNIEYKYDVKNPEQFKKLCLKFNNFETILAEWYKDSRYYSYLEDLWENYISIEELGNKRDLEKYLKLYSIDYNTWPADIKHNFRRLINGTRDTMVYKLKEEIDEKYSEINDLLKELYSLNKKLK